MNDDTPKTEDTHVPSLGPAGFWATLSDCWGRRREWRDIIKLWLFAEEDSQEAPTPRETCPLLASDVDPAAGIFSLVVHLCGVAALALLLYWHVPSFGTWADGHLRALRLIHTAAEASDEEAEEPDPEEDAPTRAAFPADAPLPPPLPSALFVSAEAPYIAVTDEDWVSLYRADGQKLWSRRARRAIFSPHGEAALLDQRGLGWVAVEADTARKLPWSKDMGWVPPRAQVQWSASGNLLCFEWPVDEDGARNAVGVYSIAQQQWVLQKAFGGEISCAELSAWSPDERKIAFSSNGGAIVLDVTRGTTERYAFPGDGSRLLWTPDGDGLVRGGEGSYGDIDAIPSLVDYSLGNGNVVETPIEGISTFAEAIGWMDGGRAVIYRTMCEGSADVAPSYLVRWPSGEPVAELGGYGWPEPNSTGTLVAQYGVDSDLGGPGEFLVVTNGGRKQTIDAGPVVGIPLRWLGSSSPDWSGSEEPILDWVLAYGWSPKGNGLYFVARRGLHSWSLWRWDAASQKARPVGREVLSFSGPQDVTERSFELVFATPKMRVASR